MLGSSSSPLPRRGSAARITVAGNMAMASKLFVARVVQNISQDNDMDQG